MRLGFNGCFLPANIGDVTPELCQRIRTLGFSGIGSRFRNNDPRDTPESAALRVRDVLSDNGIKLYQALGLWQNLVAIDEGVRRDAVRTQQAAIRMAGWMGAWVSHTGPGSMSAEGPWWPHPDNWTAQARKQLIKSLKECAPAAQDAGVYFCLEGARTVTLESAEVMREILDQVDSPWVGADYDSANWIDLKTAFDTTKAINSDFDLLGGYIRSAHAKDVWVENRVDVHIHFTGAGKGLVDFKTLFARMEALSPDYPVIAEGNTTEELPQVSALFHATAQELGITILDA